MRIIILQNLLKMENLLFYLNKRILLNTANHQFLYQLSNQSGGEMFDNFDIELIISTVFKNIERNKIILHSTEKTDSILNNIWFLFFLLFISTEWIVRKYNGFY